MPPSRTNTIRVPVKTERTHEENQERAYIAASRRSDRSMEARIESARRASEIHKRRTGRSLRVTEQDVANEEMYEEEDDDLPRRFQGIPNHLKTQDPEYNKKLHAYLVHTMVMRQSVASQQYPYGGFGPSMFSAGMMNMRPGPQSNAQSMGQIQPQRYQPYPTANPPASSPGPSCQQPRSASVGNVATTTGISPSPQPHSEPPRRNTVATPARPEDSETIKQENEPINTGLHAGTATTPHSSSSNYSTPNQSSPHMTAPISLFQDVYPGAEGNYSRMFTSDLPRNVQGMGLPSASMNETPLKNNTNTNTNNNADFGSSFNTKFNTTNTTNTTTAPKSNDGIKPPVYSGRTALDVTLPYMQNDANQPSTNMNFSRQASYEGGNMQMMSNFSYQDTNFDDAWDANLFNDNEFTDYEGSMFAVAPPMGSQEEVNEES